MGCPGFKCLISSYLFSDLALTSSFVNYLAWISILRILFFYLSYSLEYGLDRSLWRFLEKLLWSPCCMWSASLWRPVGALWRRSALRWRRWRHSSTNASPASIKRTIGTVMAAPVPDEILTSAVDETVWKMRRDVKIGLIRLVAWLIGTIRPVARLWLAGLIRPAARLWKVW